MVEYRYPIVARAGWPFIIVALTMASLLQVSDMTIVAAPFWGLVLLLLFLFRDPKRVVPSVPLAIIAPVDGQVIEVTTLHDPFVDREAIRISIHKGFFNLFTARSPMEGKVQKQWLGRDAQDALTLSKGYFAQWVKSDEGDDQVTLVRPNISGTRLSCYIHSGERIGQGQRCGWLPGPAIVEVFLPLNSRVEVKCGEQVLAGSGILATLVH